MKSIKFIDLIKLPDNELNNLKLIFNSDWDYEPDNSPEYIKSKLGREPRHFDLLRLYRQGEVELVRESTKTHGPNNKRYVGSAYGEDMILGRWSNYAENGYGGNLELRKLVAEKGLKYVKENFRYSILDIYKSTVDDKVIRSRESWWKKILLTDVRRYPDFGYNAN